MKLYVVTCSGEKSYIVAWTFTQALDLWRKSSVAREKADPDALELAVSNLIGVPTKKEGTKFADEPESVNVADLGLMDKPVDKELASSYRVEKRGNKYCVVNGYGISLRAFDFLDTAEAEAARMNSNK